jgi:H+/Cl- antiporter ClcA
MYAQLLADPSLLILWGLAVIAVGLLVAWLVKLEPMAGGSGIPQVEGVVLIGLRMKWVAVLIVRFLGGLLCGMFGLSLGREGPSIQIGAAASQGLSQGMKRSGLDENYLITSGAAAGLSAAFNAPLSGMMFALEEMHRNFSPVILLSSAAASLSADFVSKYWFGLTPVLNFQRLSQLSLWAYWWMIPLGIIVGLIGSLMNKLLLGLQSLYAKIPAWSGPVVALIIALPCGLFLPQVLGGGEELIGLAERASGGLASLALLLLVKMTFTATSFGSGVPGGIFMPILTVGTLTGSIAGILAVQAGAWGLTTSDIAVISVCAMAGALSASVKAPMTSILLTVEMSGTLVHMLPVATCAFTALFVSDALHIKPIYESLLERYMDAHNDMPDASDVQGRSHTLGGSDGSDARDIARQPISIVVNEASDQSVSASHDLASQRAHRSKHRTFEGARAFRLFHTVGLRHPHAISRQESIATLEIPIEFGSRAAGNLIGDIEWPQGAAVVDIRRGEQHLVPHAHAMLMPGDYVFVSFAISDFAAVRRDMTALCSGRL